MYERGELMANMPKNRQWFNYHLFHNDGSMQNRSEILIWATSFVC